MKILIALCSLATFAIAVPVYEENVFESSLSNQASSTKRVRKSALPDTPGLFSEHGTEKISIQSNKKSSQGTTVEAKSFRRPIIIKRKLGYHVYRDSDEEMAYAEPGEKCREQVKFKLCDHEPVSSSKNGIKSPTFKCFNNHKTDNEMENSIIMAKEAVEHLQKDLKRMEFFSPKISNPHIEDIESNTELHHDIEIAREALEHIEHNFESVNLEVNKVNELQVPKSQDEERLTRWREAIENIHKNFQIVKNIEDAFKSNNHYSLFRSDSRKTVDSEKPEHLGHVYVQHKFTNDNLENNDEAYNGDKILKSASNEDGIAHLTPKTENVDNIGNDMGNDMFVSPAENSEDKIRLHSDSLKSDINYKDTFLRSDVSGIESTKHESNVPKESVEYDQKKSLSEVPNYSEHEKTASDHISDDYKLLSKVSSNSYDSLDENVQIEEQKTIDKSELMMKTALSDRDNRNLLIKMKSVKEILGNKKDQEKAATSNEKNINEYEELNSKNENSPLERLRLMPTSNIEQTSTNIENYKNSEAGGDEKIHSDKYNNKEIENQENKSKSYSSVMRLNNDQLDKTDQLSAYKFVTTDQDVLQSPHLFSLKEKNVLGDEENDQNESHHKIKENHEFHDSLKGSEKEVKDKVQNFKSSEVKDGKIGSDIIQNQELTSFLNDDSVKKVDKKVPKLYKTVSEASNEPILNDRAFENQHSIEENKDLAQNKDANEDSKLQFSKSVSELYSDSILSMPTEKIDISNDQHSHISAVRLSQTQNEKFKLNEYHEGDEHTSTRFDIENSSEDTKSKLFKSVPELNLNPIASLPMDKVEISNDQQTHRAEMSMRSSEIQEEKMHLNENQELQEPLPIGLDIKSHAEEHTWQSPKSVPELTYDPMVSMPTEKVDITDDQHAHKEEASMRSSESQNEKMHSNENQELHEPLSKGLDIESHAEERTWQSSKSVPELTYDAMVSMPTEKVDITDDQHAHKEEASMRSSESPNDKNQNEKLLLNEYQEGADHVSTTLNNEHNSDDTKTQYLKSVPELQYYPIASLLTDKVDITNDQHFHKEDASMRSSGSYNEKMQSNEYQELHEQLPTGLDSESHPKERTWQSSKSVSEVPYDPMVSMPTRKVDITDDQHTHKEEESMRSSESQSEKLLLNEYQEEADHASTTLNNEHNSDDTKQQYLKSVPELQSYPIASLLTGKKDITNDQHFHKEDASMRSSESYNEKMQSNEYQELHEQLPMGLDSESHPKERTWQSSKSVSEVPYDPMVSMPTRKVDITDDQHTHKEEESMRSSESQSEKLLLNEYQEEADHASTTLNNEHNSDDTKQQYLKSVPELQSYPIASLLTDKKDITNDQHFHKEDASMRSSESYNEKMQSNEYQELHEQLPMGLDSESHPKERTWQSSKSVSEVPYDPMVSMPTRKVDITDEQHTHKEEESMRSSESQSEKLLLNEYQEEADHASTTLNNEHNSDDTKQQYLKSVPELQSYPMASLLTDKKDINNDQHFHKEDASIRSSDSYNEKMQSNEYQELHEQLPMGLDSESHPKERTWQSSKSVPGLPYDSMVSMPTRKVDITDDQRAQKEEESMRSSESQSEKLLLNEYQEEADHASTTLNNEHNSDDTKQQYLKSVPELQSYPMASLLTDKKDINNDRHFHKEDASMRSSESYNEKMQSNEYQELHEQLPMGLDSESHPKERTWQSSKSVPELPYDSMISIPTRKVDITDDDRAQKGEESMRSSGSQSEKLQLNENQEEPEQLPMGLGSENHPKERTWQSSKSVSEVPYDPMVSMPTRKVDIIDDQRSHKGEESMRSSERQSEKLQLNEYQEEPEHALTIFNIENNSDDSTSQLLKSVSEQQPYLIASLSRDNEGITNNQHLQGEEAIMRSADSQNEKNLSNENQNLHKPLPMGLDIERHPEERTWQSSKSVPELPNDPRMSMLTKKVDVTDDLHAHKEELGMRSSESQSEKLQLNEYQDEPEQASSKLNFENNSDDIKSDILKSVPELESHPLALFPTDKVDNTNNQHLQGEEMSMRLAVGQNEKKILNENQEVNEPLLMEIDIERHPEEHTWQSSKSVPELPYDPMESMPTDKVDITYDQYVHKEEASMRSSEAQSEKLQLNEYHEEPDHASMKLDVENNPDDIKSQFLKSVSELPFPTDEVGITNNLHLQGEKENMRSAEGQNEEIRDVHELWPMGLHIEHHPEEHTWQYYKSVPELSYDSMVSMPTEKVVIPNDQYSYTGDDSMRASETQKEKLQLNGYNNGPVHSLTRFDVKYEVDNHKPHFLKSVSELHSDPKESLPIDKVYINDDQYSHAEDSTQTHNEKLQLTDIQEAHLPFMMQLDMKNQPEDRKWQVSKSVLELPFDSMVSMPTDKVEISNEHKSLKEGNMRHSQNQNEGTQFHESLGFQDFFPTKLSTENHPEYSTSLFKSTSQLYKTRSNINHVNNENFYSPEDAKLSQNQNEGQQHLFEPLSSRPDNEKKVEEDSLTANKVRFSYIQNPKKEETTMRLSQNQNENTGMQYLSSIKGLGNEHLNREENREHIMDDYMHLSAARHQQLHENTNPMLRSSNERQHLSHNFKSRPEHKMLPPTSDRQNVLNERMRINEQQSRDPEPVENQNLHNSFSMRWNTDDQHQNPSTKTFKFNSDFDHTLHGNNEFDNEQFIPHEVPNAANTLGYRTRPQLFGDHILDDTQSNRWYQTKQYNDHFANYYKTIPEVHEEYMNPHFHKHIHRVAGNRNLNDADTFSSHDSPSNRARLHEHMQKYHQEKSSNVDSSMEQSMHMSMREPFAKTGAEFDNMHPHGTAFNHPHGTARFGAGLPIAGVNPGAVGVFPTANAGGCGIPLLLSCSPSVVSGSLARSHIAGPVFKSADDNYKYYIKRDAKNIADVPDIKVQKTSFAHNYGTSEI